MPDPAPVRIRRRYGIQGEDRGDSVLVRRRIALVMGNPGATDDHGSRREAVVPRDQRTWRIHKDPAGRTGQLSGKGPAAGRGVSSRTDGPVHDRQEEFGSTRFRRSETVETRAGRSAVPETKSTIRAVQGRTERSGPCAPERRKPSSWKWSWRTTSRTRSRPDGEARWRGPMARPDGEARWTRRHPGASLPGFRPGRLGSARGSRREALLQPGSLRTSGSTRRLLKRAPSGNRMHDLFMTLRTRTGRRVLANCRQDVPGSVRSD